MNPGRTVWLEMPQCGGVGLCGVAPNGVQMRRHSAGCKPGQWLVSVWLGSDVANLLRPEALPDVQAVMDDFGNLVGVPA